MNRYIRVALAAAATSRRRWLQRLPHCTECVTSPTSPTKATSRNDGRDAVETLAIVNGDLAVETSMFMQQMAGVGNQYQVIDKYPSTRAAAGTSRRRTAAPASRLEEVEADARANGDKTMSGSRSS